MDQERPKTQTKMKTTRKYRETCRMMCLALMDAVLPLMEDRVMKVPRQIRRDTRARLRSSRKCGHLVDKFDIFIAGLFT